MSELNVVSRTQVIVVDPAIYHVNVIDSLQLGSEREVARVPGTVLLASVPATFDTGVINGGAEQVPPWAFTLPTSMQAGDHIRIRYFGAFYGGTTLAWYARLYLDGVKSNEIYYNSSGLVSGQKMPFVNDIDLMYQSVSSAWVWLRHSHAASSATQETAVATGSSADGDKNTLVAYSNPAKNLAGAVLTFGFTAGSSNPQGLHLRGLTIEHLIAP
jgi:hypothetical protein